MRVGMPTHIIQVAKNYQLVARFRTGVAWAKVDVARHGHWIVYLVQTSTQEVENP